MSTRFNCTDLTPYGQLECLQALDKEVLEDSINWGVEETLGIQKILRPTGKTITSKVLCHFNDNFKGSSILHWYYSLQTSLNMHLNNYRSVYWEETYLHVFTDGGLSTF